MTEVTALERLLALQALDTELDQLRHRMATLPERAELSVVERRIAEVDHRVEVVSDQRADLELQQSQIESEVADIVHRVADVDRRMHSGAVTASRELTAMVDQTASLKHRRDDLEDAELELMVAAEPLDAELTSLGAERDSLDRDGVRLRGLLAEAESDIDARLAQADAARAEAVVAVPEELVRTYDALRVRLGGIGVARLVGASCGGCHLVLPAVEVDRVRRQPPDAVVTCDQCGRILVH